MESNSQLSTATIGWFRSQLCTARRCHVSWLVTGLIVLSLGMALPAVAQSSAPVSTKYVCTSQPKKTGEPTLNIGSYNLGIGDDHVKAAAIALTFEKHDLDIFALQELYRYQDKTRNVVDDIPVEFAKRFPSTKFYYYSHLQLSGHSLMIVSKFPILEQSYGDLRGGRSVLQTLLDTPYGKLRVFDTHLQRKDDAAYKSWCEALTFLQKSIKPGEPFTISGDMNQEKHYLFKGMCGAQASALLGEWCSGQPCWQGGIDFTLGGKDVGPEVLNTCEVESRLTDSHWLLLSTVKMPKSSLSCSLGDFDCNGELDRTDFQQLQRSYGTENCQQNLNGSCRVDLFDVAQWLSLLGR